MTPRDALNRAVLRVTGKDIRLVGQWSKLWCLQHSSRDIAAALGVYERDLVKCSDIAEVCDLMGDHYVNRQEPGQLTLTLFR